MKRVMVSRERRTGDGCRRFSLLSPGPGQFKLQRHSIIEGNINDINNHQQQPPSERVIILDKMEA